MFSTFMIPFGLSRLHLSANFVLDHQGNTAVRCIDHGKYVCFTVSLINAVLN